MQRRNFENSAINRIDTNKLGDVLGIVERSVNENDKLIMNISSKYSYNDLISRLFIGSYIVVIDSSTNHEVMLRVNKVEGMINSPLSIRGTEATYVRIVGEFVLTRALDNGSYKYTSFLIIPANGSLVIYPNADTIQEFLGLRGNLLLGKASINGHDIPILIKDKALDKGFLIIGQPGCGKSLLIKKIIRELYPMEDYKNIIIFDRTGEYAKHLIENGLNASILIPLDLMKLNRPIDIDELRKYIIDKLRILGFRNRVRIKMSMSKNDGIEFNVEFSKQGYGKLGVYPLSIRFRWFIERAINYLDPEIKYVITTFMLENDKALNTVQGFISAIKDPELLNTIGRSPVNKAMDLAYSLKSTGYFDAVLNVGGDNIDLSVFSPIRVLKSKLVIFDIHELPESIINIYETLLIEDIVKWFTGSQGVRAVMVVDNAEGLMTNEDLLNSVINSIRIGRIYGVSFIIAARSFSRRLHREFGNTIFMRMSSISSKIRGCHESTNLLNNEFILVSPWLNVGCIKGLIA
ncbi:MAG: helicase HerA domain-containing protein [Vulcanisaeta sp.]